MQIIDADSCAALPAGLAASPTQQQQESGLRGRSQTQRTVSNALQNKSMTHFKISGIDFKGLSV